MIGFAYLAAILGFVLAVVFWFPGQSAARAVKALRDEADAARKEAELIVQQAEDSSERLTHHALQRSAEIERAIEDLKIQRTSFRLQLEKLLELVQHVVDRDRIEDDSDRPLSYLTRKGDKGETSG